MMLAVAIYLPLKGTIESSVAYRPAGATNSAASGAVACWWMVRRNRAALRIEGMGEAGQCLLRG
jgi:hypothetical protein